MTSPDEPFSATERHEERDREKRWRTLPQPRQPYANFVLQRGKSPISTPKKQQQKTTL